MRTTIGVYKNHDLAAEAAIFLKEQGLGSDHISIIGLTETEEVDDENNVVNKLPMGNAVKEVTAGAALGTTVGVLTGVGLMAIPGVGMLYGAGALVGAIAGFDVGIIGGGLVAILANIGIGEKEAHHYQKLLKKGHYLILARGSKEEIKHAERLLIEHGIHEEVASHE